MTSFNNIKKSYRPQSLNNTYSICIIIIYIGMCKRTCPIGLGVCSSPLVQDMERLIKPVTLNSCPAGLVFTPGPWIRGTLEHPRNKKYYIHIIYLNLIPYYIQSLILLLLAYLAHLLSGVFWILLVYRWEDAKSSSELLDGSSSFKPAVSLPLLGVQELIA